MKRSLWRLTLGLTVLNHATTAFSADAPGQSSGSTIVSLIISFTPLIVILLLILPVIRNMRKNQQLYQKNLKSFDDHKAFAEEHMRRAEAQIGQLDAKLGRVIELLESIEKGHWDEDA
jgi:hypothetical protein